MQVREHHIRGAAATGIMVTPLWGHTFNPLKRSRQNACSMKKTEQDFTEID